MLDLRASNVMSGPQSAVDDADFVRPSRGRLAFDPTRLYSRVSWLIGALFGVLLWTATAPSTAHAIVIGADVEGVVPIGQTGLSAGPGFGGRLGMQLHVPLLTITPEIGFNYASFDGSAQAYRGIIGARAGIGELLRVGAYFHVGYGHVSYSQTWRDTSRGGFTFDAGGFLDLTLIPFLDLGIHIGYGNVAESDGIEALEWLAFGVHAALVF